MIACKHHGALNVRRLGDLRIDRLHLPVIFAACTLPPTRMRLVATRLGGGGGPTACSADDAAEHAARLTTGNAARHAAYDAYCANIWRQLLP